MTRRMALKRVERYITRVDDKHIIESRYCPKYVKLTPNTQATTMRRILYALLVGPIEQNLEVRPRCGRRACINPWHMELALSRNMTSKHLEFNEIIDASDVASLPNNIPRDLTPSAYVTFVDALDLGLGLSEARSAAGITTETAVAIATGTYDRWDTTFYVLHDRIKNKPPVLETREEIAPETYSPEIMAWLRQIS